MSSKFVTRMLAAVVAAGTMLSGMPVLAAEHVEDNPGSGDGNGSSYFELAPEEIPQGFENGAIYTMNPDGEMFLNTIDSTGQYLQTWEDGEAGGTVCIVDANMNVLEIENPSLLNVGDATYLNVETDGAAAYASLSDETKEFLKTRCNIDGIAVNGVPVITFDGSYQSQNVNVNAQNGGRFDEPIEKLVYNENEVKITVSEIIDLGDEVELKLRVENNRRSPVFLLNSMVGESNKRAFYINGYAIEPEKIEYQDGCVPAGATSEITVRFKASELTGRGINEVTQINAELVLYSGTTDKNGNTTPTEYLATIQINTLV